MKEAVTIYTDGASRGNPGPGGWAAIVLTSDRAVELAGNQTPATNNQMELMAVEKALQYVHFHHPEAHIVLHADSAYVLRGLATWVDGWARNGWMTLAKKPVENKSQWEALLTLRNFFKKNLELIKVAGHSGHEYNDRCDELAVAAALKKPFTLFTGSRTDYATTLSNNPPVSIKKTASSKSKNNQKAYSYVSLIEGKVYTDSDWSTCEKRVKGTKGAKYKKAFSKGEEIALIQEYTTGLLL